MASRLQTPAVWAGFANGAMAHCLDFDDRTPWGAHAGSSLMPAAFAVAERRGGVAGKQMIAAVAAAQDLFVRLRCNVGWRQDRTWRHPREFHIEVWRTGACGHGGFCQRRDGSMPGL